eukprot:TRINITY_DN9582_c0_g1_i1.p1 TRINITY_DN9582_c0_g1~~TRINITY_DN9582_c0_g1_i1.p1  ORF type:complete len:581 (-),score=121.59 TRINITY_DN9582_c0_g1_i1:148-1671(-)
MALLYQPQTYFTLRSIKEFVIARKTQLGCSSEDLHNWGDMVVELKGHTDRFECDDVGGWSLKPDYLDFGNGGPEEEMVIEYPEKRRRKKEVLSMSPVEKRKEGKLISKSREAKSFEWCHQCKQKHDHVFHCTQDCNKKYCSKCLQRHYGEKDSEIDPSTWVCVYCRQLCCCALCRKKKAKLTNTKFESRRGKKRTMRPSLRGFKKRRIDQSEDASREEDDSDDFVEYGGADEEEDDFVQESPVTSSSCLSASAPVTSTIRIIGTKEQQKCRRVSLKDLMDSGILVAGDEVYFKKTHEYSGVLLPSGQINCQGHICQSLSTFAKFAANEIGAKWSRQNGWRLVYCRSKCLFDLRRQYMENCMEGETVDFMDEEEYDEEEDEEERVSRVFGRRLRSQSTTSIRMAVKPMSLDDDEEMDEPEVEPAEVAENSSLPINIVPLETIKVARYYSWLKYEFQHEHEHIHMSPIFDDARHSFDTEHNSVVGVHDYFIDIQDEYFFPITTGTEVNS